MKILLSIVDRVYFNPTYGGSHVSQHPASRNIHIVSQRPDLTLNPITSRPEAQTNVERIEDDRGVVLGTALFGNRRSAMHNYFLALGVFVSLC